MLIKLTEADCREAMKEGDFSEKLRGRSPLVAIVLSQSWCHQWGWMRGYLESLPEDANRSIFYVEYDKEPFFEDFMEFKEDRFGNREVPYVRYYREGALVKESNFIDKAGFLRLLGSVSSS